ncbi:MAG: SEC-C domain-containing protein [Bifidobacteriaceae bacterium]|nr:SEC-C domain-containing protein [Bifidobacteriaceae bacterium]
MNSVSFPEDVPLESKMVTRGIASAQSQVEARNFEIRKNVLKYDDVMSRQRTVVYSERRRILKGEDLDEQVQSFLTDVIEGYVTEATGEPTPEDWNLELLWANVREVFPVSITPDDVIEEAGGPQLVTADMLRSELLADARLAYGGREEQFGTDIVRQLERRVLLSVLDRKWREHLYEMDYLKEGIGLRAMAQRDPLVEYQREGYQLFQAMNEAIKEQTVAYLFNVQIKVEGEEEPDQGEQVGVEEAEDQEFAVTLAGGPSPSPSRSGQAARSSLAAATAAAAAKQPKAVQESKAPVGAAVGGGRKLDERSLGGGPRSVPLQYSAPSDSGDGSTVTAGSTFARSNARRGAAGAAPVDDPAADGLTFPGTARNAQCPCGSGKKYKLCHGRNESD